MRGEVRLGWLDLANPGRNGHDGVLGYAWNCSDIASLLGEKCYEKREVFEFASVRVGRGECVRFGRPVLPAGSGQCPAVRSGEWKLDLPRW